MRGKRGQFYLLAAIVIVVVIIGFAAIQNYTKKQSPVRLYDLKDELGIESGKVLDYGTITTDVNEAELLEHFTTIYDNFIGEGKEIYYIFGNQEDVVAFRYTDDETSGQISLDVGGVRSNYNIFRRLREVLPVDLTEEGKIIITLPDGTKYEFDLKPGENFYFIISEESGGELHVVTS